MLRSPSATTPAPHAPNARPAAVREVMKAAASRGAALAAIEPTWVGVAPPAHHPLCPKRTEPPLHAVQSSFQQTEAAEKAGSERG